MNVSRVEKYYPLLTCVDYDRRENDLKAGGSLTILVSAILPIESFSVIKILLMYVIIQKNT